MQVEDDSFYFTGKFLNGLFYKFQSYDFGSSVGVPARRMLFALSFMDWGFYKKHYQFGIVYGWFPPFEE